MNELISRTQRGDDALPRRGHGAAPTAPLFASLPSSSTTRSRSHRFTRLVIAALLALAIAGPAHAAGGQLNLIPHPMWLLVMIVSFAVLIFPINAILFQPLFRTLDERADQIEGAKRRAEQLDAKAADIVERYETAIRREREQAEGDRREHLDAARQEQAQITSDARAEAERELEHARSELAGSLEQARASLRSSAEQLAGEAAERILGRSVS